MMDKKKKKNPANSLTLLHIATQSLILQPKACSPSYKLYTQQIEKERIFLPGYPLLCLIKCDSFASIFNSACLSPSIQLTQKKEEG